MKLPIVRIISFFSLLFVPLAGADNSAAPPASAATPKEDIGSARGLLGLLLRPFDPNLNMEMTVITEMTDEGRKLPAVSPDHPAYYQAESNGNREMGGKFAHEQTMTPEEVAPLLEHGLAINGYQPAKIPDHPPSLVVFYFWGTHNAIDPDIANISPNQLLRNVLDRAALVGGKKFSDEVAEVIRESQDATFPPPPVEFFKMRKANNEALLNQALGDVFYVVASAFDYQSVAKGHPVLLWRTRMTVMSQGVQMKKAIPAAVAGAGQYFGREMTDPAIIHQSSTPEGKVQIGTPTVVDPSPTSRESEKK